MTIRTFHLAHLRPVALVAALLVACSPGTGASTTTSSPGASPSPDEKPNANPNGGKAGRTGETACSVTASGTCSAGQYCSENWKNSAGCFPGCTSDANCGENERCVRCGTDDVGTCQSCSRSDDDACKSVAKPDEGCTRTTPDDRRCQTPGKAYQCASDRDPGAELGKCTQSKIATVWCCGGAVASSCERTTTFDIGQCGHPGPGGPRPPKAYSCSAGDKPTTPNCVEADLSGVWCCPS